MRTQTIGALQEVWGWRMRLEVTPEVVRRSTDPQELLALTGDGTMHLFAPDA